MESVNRGPFIFSLLVPHIDVGVVVTHLAHIHLEAVQRFDHLAQLGEAVVPGVKVGLLLHQQIAQLAHQRVAVLITQVL